MLIRKAPFGGVDFADVHNPWTVIAEVAYGAATSIVLLAAGFPRAAKWNAIIVGTWFVSRRVGLAALKNATDATAQTDVV